MKKFLLSSMCLSSLSINFGSETFALSIFESAAHGGNQPSTHHALQIYFPNLGGVNLVSAFMQESFQRGKLCHEEEKLRQLFNEATKNLQDQEQKAKEKKTEAKNTHNLVKKALQEEQQERIERLLPSSRQD